MTCKTTEYLIIGEFSDFFCLTLNNLVSKCYLTIAGKREAVIFLHG